MKRINNLAVHASGSYTGVFWENERGEREHVWLAMKKAEGSAWDHPNNGFVPVEPFDVKAEYQLRTNKYDGKRILYRSPALNADGSHKSKYDQGYFDTRRLDADAAANRETVAVALKRAFDEGMFQKAVEAADKAKAEKEAADLKERAAKMRKDLCGRREKAEGNAKLQKVIDAVALLDDGDIVWLASL